MESFKDNEFVLTEQVVKNGYEFVTSILVLSEEMLKEVYMSGQQGGGSSYFC